VCGGPGLSRCVYCSIPPSSPSNFSVCALYILSRMRPLAGARPGASLYSPCATRRRAHCCCCHPRSLRRRLAPGPGPPRRTLRPNRARRRAPRRGLRPFPGHRVTSRPCPAPVPPLAPRARRRRRRGRGPDRPGRPRQTNLGTGREGTETQSHSHVHVQAINTQRKRRRRRRRKRKRAAGEKGCDAGFG
jgi:hypothetical protein